MVGPLRRLLQPLASLKLTVALFVLAMFLIFVGTLAQVHAGIWTVMDNYFRTPIAWIELRLFIPQQLIPSDRAPIRSTIPYPGGYTLGALLLVNLLAAHIVRFRFSTRRIGIIVLHLGIVVLLLGEFVTGVFAEEGLMSIDEGSYANFVEDIREAELVILDRSDPEMEHVIAFPQHRLTREGAVLSHPELPFTVTVEQWMANSRVFDLQPGATLAGENAPGRPASTRGAGTRLAAEPIPLVSGIDGATYDVPSARIRIHQRDVNQSADMGTWLVSVFLDPEQTVTVGDRTWHIGLRFKRTYKPYTLHLTEFRHDRFVGTDRPRNFASYIRLVDPQRNEDRQVIISMNNPLRYDGATFYQSAYKEGDSGTILQVVRNPGWLLPYIACVLVTLGMTIHFTMHLIAFIRSTV